MERGSTVLATLLLEGVLDGEVSGVMVRSRELDDTTTRRLLEQVVREILERLRMDVSTEHAIARLRFGSKCLDPASRRNQIFKAADLLQLELPHHMF